MPRRREIEKRDILPDPKFNNKLVAKFVNSLLKRGKKSIAESILYGAFDIIEKKVKEQPVEFFEKAVNNVKPVIEVLLIRCLRKFCRVGVQLWRFAG
jgi:small subunit ribosomal protein S7